MIIDQLKNEIAVLKVRAYELSTSLKAVEQQIQVGTAMLSIAIKTSEEKDEELARRIDADIAAEVQS